MFLVLFVATETCRIQNQWTMMALRLQSSHLGASRSDGIGGLRWAVAIPRFEPYRGIVMLHHHGFAMSEAGNTGGDYFEG